MLHAGGERRQVWAPVSEVLVGAGFRCAAFNQRGHGDSDGRARALSPCAEDVAAMLRTEPPGCVVVGASLGGLAAIAALTDPAARARVAGLVLVDVVPCLEPSRVRRFLGELGPVPLSTIGSSARIRRRQGSRIQARPRRSGRSSRRRVPRAGRAGWPRPVEATGPWTGAGGLGTVVLWERERGPPRPVGTGGGAASWWGWTVRRSRGWRCGGPSTRPGSRAPWSRW
ncbi:alpha/beta hydrolase [Kitasatospora sp. NPDC001159]